MMRTRAVALSVLAVLFVSFSNAAAAAEMEPVRVGFGSLSLHMVLQAGFNYYIGDETLGVFNNPEDENDARNGAPQAVDRPDNYEFLLHRFRFITRGTILTDKITYFTQTEFVAQNVELYDLFISFKYIPYTALNFGKFLPDYGFFVPRSTADLVFIDYPLYALQFMADGPRHWRHTGFWVDVKSQYVDAQVGIWNGFTAVDTNGDGVFESYRGANFSDDTNSGKDVTVSVTGKPPLPGLEIRGSFWWGQPLAGYENDEGELKEFDNTVYLFGGGFFYRAPFGLTLGGEYHQRYLKLADFETTLRDAEGNPQVDDEGNPIEYDPHPDFFNSRSFYAMAGFNLNHVAKVPLEFIARYDSYDPNTKNRSQEPSVIGTTDSAHDLVWIATGAVNYYFEGLHAVLRLNYIHRAEEWKDVLDKKGTNTQTGIADDQIKLQAQVAF